MLRIEEWYPRKCPLYPQEQASEYSGPTPTHLGRLASCRSTRDITIREVMHPQRMAGGPRER